MINHELWCKSLQEYWQEKNIAKILSLFSEKVTYYETPRDLLNSKTDIAAAWEEIKNQSPVIITYKILCVEGNKCIANFYLDGSSAYDMIYEILLDETNKCTYFKQWFMCLGEV